jgi:hypothetical protein
VNRLPAALEVIVSVLSLPSGQSSHEVKPEGILIPEDVRMSILKIALAAVLVAVVGGKALAFETDFDDLKHFDRSLPAWKLGRGVVDVLSGPHELFAHMTNAAIDGGYYGAYDDGLQGFMAGSANGFIAGSLTGAVAMAKRMTTGLLEIVTFWKPEYGPTLDPEYGTRCQADPHYFDPEPFWYLGPERP